MWTKVAVTTPPVGEIVLAKHGKTRLANVRYNGTSWYWAYLNNGVMFYPESSRINVLIPTEWDEITISPLNYAKQEKRVSYPK